MSDLRLAIGAVLGSSLDSTPLRRVEGGCINTCYRVETAARPYFVKCAPAAQLDRFAAEAAGLQELERANALRVPRVIACGTHDEYAILALEWLDLSSLAAHGQRELGRRLAQQHRVTKPLFGFKRHNYIGATPQINYWSRSWVNFWREHRLEAQLNLAERNGIGERFLERASLLLAICDGFFAHTPVASLLHGDLWSGNVAGVGGEPALCDPAVYYGDRECDIAMTRLFGGFTSDFYAAYEDAWPLDDGWEQRTDLYNLYHVLNHFNLFGGGYDEQAEQMVNRLLAELGH